MNFANKNKSISKVFVDKLDDIDGKRISFVEINEPELDNSEQKLKSHHSVYDHAQHIMTISFGTNPIFHQRLERSRQSSRNKPQTKNSVDYFGVSSMLVKCKKHHHICDYRPSIQHEEFMSIFVIESFSSLSTYLILCFNLCTEGHNGQ